MVAFDITMVGYHGAEACELVDLYMLSEISKFVSKQNIGLYRDDGLMVIEKQTGQKTERLKLFIPCMYKIKSLLSNRHNLFIKNLK